MPSELKIELREYLLLHYTVIVMDDSEHLFNDLPKLRALLIILSPAVVFMTCSGTYGTLPDTVAVTLQELNEIDTHMFTAHLVSNQQHTNQVHEGQIAAIWNCFGGNPLALQLVIGNLPYFDLKNMDDLIGLNTVYDRIFHLLDEMGRMTWIILALGPLGGVDFNTLQYLWTQHITHDSLGNLLQHHIIETSAALPHYRLITGARRYIEGLYHKDTYIHNTINRLLLHYDAIMHDRDDAKQLPLFLSQLESLLSADWIEIDTHLRKKWIATWWAEGIGSKHWATCDIT